MSPLTDSPAVIAQLERILASPTFRLSRRHSSLLRHLVEQTLAGQTASLKERTLGVNLFGRPAEYDNNTDPIVRVSVGELRRRLARYYHEPGHEHEIRVELPLGSYIPEFVDPVVAEPAPAEIPAVVAQPARRRGPVLLAALAGALLLALLAWWQPWLRPDASRLFWSPFLESGAPVTVCLARTALTVGPPPPAGSRALPALVAWPDLMASTKVAALLAAAGRQYQLRRDDTITFEDLRQGPAVLVGAFNDIWTLRLTENLRFEFQYDGGVRWISDRRDPASRAWSNIYPPQTPLKHDFAVISRLLTGRSGRPVLTIAGLGGLGTDIAGEFVTHASFLNELARRAPAGWPKQNLQVVIQTEIIEGHAGPPAILAVHTW